VDPHFEGPTLTSAIREHRFAEDRILEAVGLQHRTLQDSIRPMAFAPPDWHARRSAP
jgi:hypothetical protein